MPLANQFEPKLCGPTASIANGGTTSAAIDLAGTTLCGIHLPPAFTGTSLTFQTAPAFDGTYQPVHENGAAIAVAVSQGSYAALNPVAFAGIEFLKIVSNAPEAAARSLTLAVRPV